MYIEKPWGHEEIIENNGLYVIKLIFMKKDHQCSMQYHEKKHETIMILDGEIELVLVNEIRQMIVGEFHSLPPLTFHRMRAVVDSGYLEVSTPELDDVVRVSDDYDRI